MKSIYLIIFLFSLSTCTNFRKLSDFEQGNLKFNNTHQKILNKFDNSVVLHHYNFQKSKLIYIDNNGNWNLVEWNNNDFKKTKFNKLPKYLISDSLVVEIQDEIFEKSNNLKFIHDSSTVKFEFKYPTNIETISYKRGNIETFKKEKFNSEYLKIIQRLILKN